MTNRYERPLTTEEIAALADADIDTSDIPDLGEAFWRNAKVVMPEERSKTQVTAKFDADMVAWFKRQGRDTL